MYKIGHNCSIGSRLKVGYYWANILPETSLCPTFSVWKSFYLMTKKMMFSFVVIRGQSPCFRNEEAGLSYEKWCHSEYVYILLHLPWIFHHIYCGHFVLSTVRPLHAVDMHCTTFVYLIYLRNTFYLPDFVYRLPQYILLFQVLSLLYIGFSV